MGRSLIGREMPSLPENRWPWGLRFFCARFTEMLTEMLTEMQTPRRPS